MDTASIEDLRDFVQRVERLGRTRLLAIPGNVLSFDLKWEQGGPLRASASEPDEDTLEAFLSVLRPLVLFNERTSLRKVFDLCELHLQELSLRSRLREIRQLWKEELRTGPIKLVLNGEHWRPEAIAHLILNAYHAHDDREKRRRLRELGPIELMLTRQVFIGFAIETASVAMQVAAVVRAALAEGLFS